MLKKIGFIGLLFCIVCNNLCAQTIDTSVTKSQQVDTSVSEKVVVPKDQRPRLLKQMIIPITFTSYGFAAIAVNSLKTLDQNIKKSIWDDHPHSYFHLDDWLQYAPGLSPYLLNLAGYKGSSSIKDYAIKHALSWLTLGAVVETIKKITQLRRPNGVGNSTFPSGHTALSFAGAEQLNQEYKARTWIVPAIGYSAATVVGYLRMYNNKHWFKDVVAGAGIGMGITKLVYWFYPKIKKKLWPDKKKAIAIL